MCRWLYAHYLRASHKITIMKILRTLSVLSLALLLNGCGNLRIKAYQTYQAPADVKNLVVTGFYIAPPQLPTVPAGDADAFNKKVEALSEKINASLATNSDRYYNTLAEGLQMQLNLNTIAGADMAKKPRFDRIKQKEERELLKVEGNPQFPTVYLSEEAVQFLELENGDVKAFIEESPRLRSAVRNVTKATESELLAIGYARLVIDKVTTYGAKANLRLLADIYLFDEKGEMVGHTYGETEPHTFTGEYLGDFNDVLASYTSLQAEMLTALTLVEEEKVDED